MVGYRNAVYDYKNECVELHTWSENGDRIITSVKCNPYFFYEDINGTDESIFNTKVKLKSFKNIFDKNKFIKERGLTRLFHNFAPVQQTLIDLFSSHNDGEDFSKFPLKICFLDIEAVGKFGFSSPTDPKEEICVITLYDSLKKKYTVLGLQQYSNPDPDVNFVFCSSEEELLNRFIDIIRDDPPDILSGWNSDRYDIPYIVNRIVKILGSEKSYLLSPYNRVYTKTFLSKFNKQEIVYRFDGISCVDYLDIYKKFCMSNRENYKLDYIGNAELGESKVDYGNQSLYEFMVNDWNTFVDYNVQDVKLLVKLEEKLKYIELLRMLSYVGCITFEGGLGTVGVVTGAAAIEARKRNQRLVTFVVGDEDVRDFEGGFVSVPLAGHHNSVVSFDANSLYPNTMITLNCSPETKIGKIISIDKGNVSIRNVDGVIVNLNNKTFSEFIKKEKLSISKAKVLFSQKKRGILPELMDSFYKKRVKIREDLKKLKMLKEKDQSIKNKIDQLDTKQQAIKIFLNSTYGAAANKFCPIGDTDIAESITLTGQAVIKQSREIYKTFIKNETGITNEKEIEMGLIAGDTDSLYVSISKLVKDFSIDGKITKEAYQVTEKFQNYLNQNINLWAKKSLNTEDCRFEFKRESMCDNAIFLEKKRYVLHLLDKEGIPCDDWKYTGVEVVSTKMPKNIKKYVRKIIENIVMTKSEKSTNDIFKECYNKFLEMDIQEISQVSSIRNMEKYTSLSNGFSTYKGTPYHVKAAYYYNLLLDELGISNKYEKIMSGDKIKLFNVEFPNFYGIKAIAFKSRYPEEFKSIFKPDMEEMFEKDMYKCVERFYRIMNWSPRKPTDQLLLSLDDILC
jgi:DNA polymerase elongation subunit (family B)